MLAEFRMWSILMVRSRTRIYFMIRSSKRNVRTIFGITFGLLLNFLVWHPRTDCWLYCCRWKKNGIPSCTITYHSVAYDDFIQPNPLKWRRSRCHSRDTPSASTLHKVTIRFTILIGFFRRLNSRLNGRFMYNVQTTWNTSSIILYSHYI